MQEIEKILEEIYIKIAGSMGRKREGLLEAEGIIRKHMSGKDTDVPTNDGWIPVEDALPEGKALACDKYGEIMIGYIGGNANGGYDCEGDGYEMFNVLAWRPLPEPYRPEKEGEKNGRP